MKFKAAILFFAGFIVAAGLAPFAMHLDVFQAIGLSIVIVATCVFIFAALTILGLVAFIAWHMGIETLQAAWDALKREGLVKEAAE